MNIHRGDDTNPVGFNYPLPTTSGYDASYSFSASLITNNATVPVTVKAGTSGKSIYITDIVISANAANLVYLEDGDGLQLIPLRLGANVIIPIHYKTATPVTQSKNLMLRSTTAVSIAIQVNGFII